MKKFLVVCAHPDDVDFVCAGTVAKLTREDKNVEYLIVSDGSKGSHAVGFGGRRLAVLREKEQRAAAKVLGVKAVHFLREQDGEVENTRALRKKIVRVIRRIKPEVVLAQDPFSFPLDRAGVAHRDHRQAAEAVFDAVYPASGSASFFPELSRQGFKPHSPKEIWFFGTGAPNKFVNISKTIKVKLAALAQHRSQIKDLKQIESRIKQWARSMGKKKGLHYAEAFRRLKLT